jgi:hypothetical protein
MVEMRKGVHLTGRQSKALAFAWIELVDTARIWRSAGQQARARRVASICRSMIRGFGHNPKRIAEYRKRRAQIERRRQLGRSTG